MKTHASPHPNVNTASLLVVLLLVGLAGAIVYGQASAGAAGAAGAAKSLKNPVSANAASITAGAATYKKYCGFCHGDDAKGEGAMAPKDSHPPDLTDEKTEHGSTDGEMFAFIRAGGGPKSAMKPFEAKLSEQDTWNVVNYLKSLRPKDAH